MESNNGKIRLYFRPAWAWWMPGQPLIIRGLLNCIKSTEDESTVECPTDRESRDDALEVARTIRAKASSLFTTRTRTGTVRYPAAPGSLRGRSSLEGLSILFYENFHGDNGAGRAATRPAGRGHRALARPVRPHRRPPTCCRCPKTSSWRGRTRQQVTGRQAVETAAPASAATSTWAIPSTIAATR